MLFEVLFLFVRWVPVRPASIFASEYTPKAVTILVSSTSVGRRQIQRTEVQLKPKTIKCYACHLACATGIVLRFIRPLIRWAEGKTRDGDGLNDSSRRYFGRV